MSESPSASCFRRILGRCFKPSSSTSQSEPETFPSPDKIPENFNVFVLHSASVSVTSIATDLSSHLKELGVSVVFSGDESISSASVCILFLSKDFADSTDRLKELWNIHKCKTMDLIPIFFNVRPSETRKVDQGVFMEAFAKARKNEDYEEGWKEAFERTALIPSWKFSDYRGKAQDLFKAVTNVMKKMKCDVFLLHSGSLSVTSIVTDLSSHLKKLGVSVAFSGDASILSASVCILFLSKDFADSTYRLKELRMIHECKMDLIPIFFDVRPSEARKVDQGVFMDAFAKASKEEEEYEEGWKEAFERTALYSGWKFSDFRGNARNLLKAVVQSVMQKVNSSSLQVAKHPVGLKEKTEKLEKLRKAGMNLKRARVMGIVGMGGIGKTTLAKEFFNTTRNEFKAACFVEDVKGRVDKTGIERVQSLLLKDLLQIDHQIQSVNQGKYLLKKCLLRSEVIIVLDNIDDSDHLDALWVPEYIHQKSIILITTRDRKLLECIPNSLIYDMEGLETKYARELFCWHAFALRSPVIGFNILVEGFVNYCNGLPLSLETLGGKLFGEEGPVWEETLKNIAESLPGDIEKQLRVSYDALDLFEKQIFLDIALFFIGEDKEMAVRIWKALGWYGSVGVLSLQQKCLVKLENGQFQMHDQLRQMAVKIVDDENTQNPGCRSRLWRPNDVMTVLSHESGSENIQAITLAAKQIQDERLHSSIVPTSEIVRNHYGGLSSSWSIRSFASMTELRLLILEGSCVEGDFRLLSKKILWLRWRHCPSGPLPMGLPVQNLRILDLSGGKMSSLWSDTHQIPVHLEELHLRGCMSLQRFPKSIKFLNGLEKLILSQCLGIADLPDGLCDIYSLKHVDLSGCRGLRSLPDRMGNWKRLQFLDLSNCEELEYLPSSFGDLEKLEHLDLKWCSALSKLTSSFHKLVDLRYLNMDMCMKLQSENDLTVGFSKLELLNTIMCKRFILPDVITFQHCIRILKVSCSQFKVLPEYLGHLENLEELSLWQGYEVKALDPFVFTKLSKLKELTIGQFPLLDGLGASLGHLRQLKSLFIIQLRGLSHFPEEIGSLQGLERLIILDCSKLAKLPAAVKELSSLTTLSLTGCSRLQLDPEAFPNISSLQKLHLGNCKVADHFFQFVCEGGSALKELELKKMRLPEMKYIGAIPSNSAALSILSCTNISYFEIFRGMSSLTIHDCPGLKKITVPVHNTSLQILNLSNCENLVEICFIENLKNLKNLNINGCFDLHTVDGLEKLSRLSEFRMFLSDWYLFHSNNWLKKTLNTIKIPHATHLSATVDLQKHPLNLPTGFEEIPRYSSTKFRFSPGRISFCGVVICCIARHSVRRIVTTFGEKDLFYQSISLRLVNGANDTEICQYKIPDPSTFCHVSIFMDEFLVSEMSAAGSELVISSVTEDLVFGAWIFLIPTNKKHLGGEVACNLIENLKIHKSSLGDYVSRSDLAKKKLEDEFGKMVIDMDLRGIHALGIRNFVIQRTYTFNDFAIYVETIGPLTWEKHRQVLFVDLDRLKHLDLELGRSCRNLVERPVFDHFEARVLVVSFERSTTYRFAQLRFPPEGDFENYYSLERIISSHKTAPWRTYT